MSAPLTRRSLLVGLAASATIGADTSPDLNIAVIGAGVSGLAAARALSQRGLRVTVFEARNRIGGRLFTDRSLGFPFEMGANWIHGETDNPIVQLAKTTGIIAKPTDFDDWRVIKSDGTKAATTDPSALQTLSDGLYEALEEAATPENIAKPLSQIFSENQQLKNNAKGNEDLLAAAIERDIAGEYGANPSEVSGALDLFGEYFEGEDLLVENGYDRLVNHLAKDLDIQLNEPVLQVSHSPNGVTLRTANGNSTFDKVIVTVPLGVLKSGSIAFDPPLSKSRQAIIERTGFGNFERAILTFDKPFDLGALNVSLVGDNPWTDLIDISSNLGLPAVLAYCGGQNARKVAAVSSDESREWMLKSIHAATGDTSLQPSKFTRSSWHTDKWAQGSYSFPTTRNLLTDFSDLSKPESPTLYFAGEACSPHYATVNGAYLSGLKAAKQVLVAQT